ncbi:MAG TPA: PepSY domain-containing protein [Acetobacteraceae bacterium]
MKTPFITLALAGLLATGALAGTAFAASNDESNEATALQNAKVTLPQAIATAEQQTGGRAFDAGVDTKGTQTRIAVETNGSKGVQTVIVDAQSGQVIGTHAGGETD